MSARRQFVIVTLLIFFMPAAGHGAAASGKKHRLVVAENSLTNGEDRTKRARTSSNEMLLMDAVHSNNVDEVKIQLTGLQDPNLFLRFSQEGSQAPHLQATAFFVAVFEGLDQVVEAMIQDPRVSINKSAKGASGKTITPLSMAIAKLVTAQSSGDDDVGRREKIVDTLLSQPQLIIDQESDIGHGLRVNALVTAIHRRADIATIKKLIARGAALDKVLLTKIGGPTTPALEVVYSNDPEFVGAVIPASEVNKKVVFFRGGQPRPYAYTPLFAAVVNGLGSAVEALLEIPGIDVDLPCIYQGYHLSAIDAAGVLKLDSQLRIMGVLFKNLPPDYMIGLLQRETWRKALQRHYEVRRTFFEEIAWYRLNLPGDGGACPGCESRIDSQSCLSLLSCGHLYCVDCAPQPQATDDYGWQCVSCSGPVDFLGDFDSPWDKVPLDDDDSDETEQDDDKSEPPPPVLLSDDDSDETEQDDDQSEPPSPVLLSDGDSDETVTDSSARQKDVFPRGSS